ncbi:MAG: YbdD/YjiX family protein [Actinomycetota bacterium]|nr:YbdD/YjiX family protein [Actinomycetota bacterium]
MNPLREIWEYLKEISGENAYDKYLVVHSATHPGRRPMNRNEFYRWR